MTLTAVSRKSRISADFRLFKQLPASAVHQRFQHLRIQFSNLLFVGNRQDQSPHRGDSQRDAAIRHKVIFLQKQTDVRLVIVVMDIFDVIRQPARTAFAARSGGGKLSASLNAWSATP